MTCSNRFCSSCNYFQRCSADTQNQRVFQHLKMMKQLNTSQIVDVRSTYTVAKLREAQGGKRQKSIISSRQNKNKSRAEVSTTHCLKHQFRETPPTRRCFQTQSKNLNNSSLVTKNIITVIGFQVPRIPLKRKPPPNSKHFFPTTVNENPLNELE